MPDHPIISIVDDDQGVRESLKMLIDSIGLDAKGFASAEEFLESGSLSDSTCLILDVQLPGMSGIELQVKLSDLGSLLPIIFITAYPDQRAREQAIRAGAIRFLDKPFSSDELLSAFQAANLL